MKRRSFIKYLCMGTMSLFVPKTAISAPAFEEIDGIDVAWENLTWEQAGKTLSLDEFLDCIYYKPSGRTRF